jgi:hypothetical protein
LEAAAGEKHVAHARANAGVKMTSQGRSKGGEPNEPTARTTDYQKEHGQQKKNRKLEEPQQGNLSTQREDRKENMQPKGATQNRENGSNAKTNPAERTAQGAQKGN